MSIVIIGAGLAGATAATELREQGYEGPVVLLGSEQHAPYERPPLSKSYLLGDDPFEKAEVHPLDWYAEHDVDLRLGVTATALDTDARTVSTTAGDLRYERLLLATGAEPRVLTVGEQSGRADRSPRGIGRLQELADDFLERVELFIARAGEVRPLPDVKAVHHDDVLEARACGCQ